MTLTRLNTPHSGQAINTDTLGGCPGFGPAPLRPCWRGASQPCRGRGSASRPLYAEPVAVLATHYRQLWLVIPLPRLHLLSLPGPGRL